MNKKKDKSVIFFFFDSCAYMTFNLHYLSKNMEHIDLFVYVSVKRFMQAANKLNLSYIKINISSFQTNITSTIFQH